MSYVVSHKTVTDGGASRFKRITSYQRSSDQMMERLALEWHDPNRTVKCIAAMAAEDYDLTGEFLVRYEGMGAEWTAHVRVTTPPPPSLEATVL